MGVGVVNICGGKAFLPLRYEKLTKCSNFTHYLPEICPNFTLCFPEKSIFPEFFFNFFFLGGGGGQPLARGWAPGPPPAKSGPGPA